MPRFALFHAVPSRSFVARWLLEEGEADYELVTIDLKNKRPELFAANPDGKVPVLLDRGPNGDWKVVITESVAIGIYLGDVLRDAKLAPPPDSPLRGPYLTWCVYRAAAVEPSLADTMFPRQKEMPRASIGWPTFPDMLKRIETQLTQGPWMLGDDFTVADVVLGGMFYWLDQWKRLPPSAIIEAYVARLKERPALQRTSALDGELAAQTNVG